jgi:hypothetical protein
MAKVRLVVIRNLAQRQWRTIIWVAQEFLLPKTDPVLICGRHRIPWTDYTTCEETIPNIN